MNADKLTRLPAGRHGLSPDVVADNQRQRLIDAFARTVAEKGYRATTVADITSLASVSRNVFYDQFGGKDECFIAVYEIIRVHVRDLMLEAAEPYSELPERLIASLNTVLTYFSSEPDLARLALIEPLSAGPAMTAHHEAAIKSLVSRRQGLRDDSEEQTADADEVLLLGAIALIVRRINLGQAEELDELLPGLAKILLSPFVKDKRIAQIVKRVQSAE